ncbi:MAG: VanW family protein [Chloroflexi bacterium]|nr:VanW family protein [Chloroflexota bacterium]
MRRATPYPPGRPSRLSPGRVRAIPGSTRVVPRFHPGWIIGLFFAAVLLMALVLLFTFYWVYSQRIILGVQVAKIDVGGLTREEAREMLAANFTAYATTPFPLRYGGQEWKVSPRELGARFDVEKMVQSALNIGKGGIVQLIRHQQAALETPYGIEPIIEVDGKQLQFELESLAKVIDKPAVNASLRVENQEIRVNPSRPGLVLDREKAAQLIKETFPGLSFQAIDLPVKEVKPSVVEADLAEVKAKAERITATPFTLKYGERSWVLDRPALASLVRFQEETDASGKPQIAVNIEKEKLTPFAKGIAGEIYQTTQDARFQWNNGVLTPIVPSQEGRTLDVAQLTETIVNKLATSPERIIPLPVMVIKPRVDMADVAKLGIKEKIDERSTSYAGSTPERAYNVRLGATKIHGVVIPPGDVFSFNDTVGEISEATGYQMGFAIIEKETVPDAGGGICQVSTTLFQPAFWAGLPIVERFYHAYRIKRYEPPAGLDSTIYPPNVDLKFRNDTNAYLLIQAWTDDSRIYVALYGTKPGREVTIDGPYFSNVQPADPTVIKQYTDKLAKGREVWVEQAEDGVDVTLTRIVTAGGRQVSRSTFVSRYRPERNVLLIGTRE